MDDGDILVIVACILAIMVFLYCCFRIDRQQQQSVNSPSAYRQSQRRARLEKMQMKVQSGDIFEVAQEFSAKEKRVQVIVEEIQSMDGVKILERASFKYSSQQPVCGICQREFRVGDSVQRHTCSKVFHRECVDDWLRAKENTPSKGRCPACRDPIVEGTLFVRYQEIARNILVKIFVDKGRKGSCDTLSTVATIPEDKYWEDDRWVCRERSEGEIEIAQQSVEEPTRVTAPPRRNTR